jgi:hypothetical protein
MQNAPRSGAFLLSMFNYFLRAKNELKSIARKNQKDPAKHLAH